MNRQQDILNAEWMTGRQQSYRRSFIYTVVYIYSLINIRQGDNNACNETKYSVQ